MIVLVVGPGGREHALAWALSRSPSVERVVVAPGNGGTRWPAAPGQAPCENAPVGSDDLDGLVELARGLGAELTVVGPEAPLAAGLADRLQAAGLAVFGPSAQAAQLEASKRFAKWLMVESGIPTADYRVYRGAAAAREGLGEFGFPIVVKADGLAAGKGVGVFRELAAAQAFLEELEGLGDTILVEEFLEGPELSVLAFCDGRSVLTMPCARDHKRLLDGDEGPNTGGMGAFAPVPDVSPELLEEVRATVLEPAVAALAERGTPYVGVLYAGLVLTVQGPKVLEFNCRFGDPETQVILPLFRGDLARLMLSCARGSLDARLAAWSDEVCAAVVMASGGYPGSSARGYEIRGLGQGLVFHAGTALQDGKVVTAGGRVLAAVGLGEDLGAALEEAYRTVEGLEFEGAHYRRDIGGHRVARVGG